MALAIKNVKDFFESKKDLLNEQELKTVFEIINKIETSSVEVDVNKSEEYKLKGNEAFGKGQLEEALDFYNKSIEADSKNHLVYSNRALVHHKLKNNEKAISDCLAGIEIEPSFVKFYVRLAMIYSESDKEKAIEYCNKGLEYDGENKALKDLLKNLTEEIDPMDMMKGFDPSKIAEMMKDERIKGMVDNLIKDKSPEELSKMMSDMIGRFKK